MPLSYTDSIQFPLSIPMYKPPEDTNMEYHQLATQNAEMISLGHQSGFY